MEIKECIDSIFDELVQIRRDFHRHPELGTEEIRTSKKICEYLEELGIPYKCNVAGTGIVGLIQGKENGKTVALRADMDALPLEEETDIPYKSVYSGKMHACGHDAHMTILLGAAKVLNKMKKDFKGNIKLLFQPAEETVGGAKRMIEEGCMEKPKVDYVLGLHVSPDLETGKIGLKYGKVCASSDEIHIVVNGKSGHGAYPHEATDAIVVSGHIICALQSIVSRNISPLDSVAVTIGTINGGTKNNIIADRVEMTGTMRTLEPETRRKIKQKIKETVENIAISFGTTGEVSFIEGYESMKNNKAVTEIVDKTAQKILGVNNIIYGEIPQLGSEDFSFFSNLVPGAFYNLGCNDIKINTNNSLHNNRFYLDEECLRIGVLLQVKNAIELLSQ